MGARYGVPGLRVCDGSAFPDPSARIRRHDCGVHDRVADSPFDESLPIRRRTSPAREHAMRVEFTEEMSGVYALAPRPTTPVSSLDDGLEPPRVPAHDRHR